MDGNKLDIEAVRDVQNFSKAKMVIEDLDIDDVILQSSTTNKKLNDSIKAVGGASKIINENGPEKLEAPASDPKAIADAIRSAIRSSRSKRQDNSSGKILTEHKSSSSVKVLPFAEKPKPDIRSIFNTKPESSQARVQESSTKPIIRPVGSIPQSSSNVRSSKNVTSSRKNESEKSANYNTSNKRSNTKSKTNNDRDRSDLIPPSKVSRSPIQSGINIPEPELSQQAQDDIKRDEEEYEEVDMMPRTDDEKHLYWKTRLQILKTRFKDVTIPKNNADMEWRSLRKIYYIEMDRVSISKNVEGYKMLMIVMFFILEYVGARFLKLNITGFTVHSLKTMHRYERLLIELGEKDYSSFGASWPIELRLAGLVAVNAVIFVIAKYIFKFTGQDSSDEFFELFQNLGNATVEADIEGPAGLDAPAPGVKPGGGGMMDMLSGLIGSFTGGGNAGGNAGGGLGSILNMFMGGNANNNATPANNTGTGGTAPTPSDDAGDTEEGSRVRLPTFRRKAKKKSENDE